MTNVSLENGNMPRQLKCECGECHICKMREYTRRVAAEKKTKESSIVGFQQRSAQKKRDEELKEIEKSREPIITGPGSHIPIAIQIIDHTRIGLHITVYRESRVLCVSISLPDKEMSVERIPMAMIRVKEIKSSETVISKE